MLQRDSQKHLASIAARKYHETTPDLARASLPMPQ